MSLWTLISIATSIVAASLWVLPKNHSKLDAPVVIKWWIDYLVPLDDLAILYKGPHEIYIRVFDTQKEEWSYTSNSTLKDLDDSNEPTIVLRAPCRNDLGFKALRSLLVGPMLCEIFVNRSKFKPYHIALIPPEVLRSLSSNELATLIGPLSIVEIINHYVDIGQIHVLWKKLFDKFGKCLVLDWHQHSLVSTRYLGLQHLTMNTLLNGWDLLVPRLNLVSLLPSLTPRIWDLFIEYMAKICRKRVGEVRKWHPLMVLVEMGLRFDEYTGFTSDEFQFIAEHFCDRKVMGMPVIQRVVLFLEKTQDRRFRVFVLPMVHHYWSNMVRIEQLSEALIDEYVVSRTIMKTVPLVSALDPLFSHLAGRRETEFSPQVCSAILRLWPWPEFRRLVLASLIHADFSALTYSDEWFEGIQRFEDLFDRPELYEYLTFSILLWLDFNVDYVLPEKIIKNLCLRARDLTAWIEERSMIHLILIHQSQFFLDTPLMDQICQTILADIMLKVDPYYIKLTLNMLKQLSKGTNPFAYFRLWTDAEFCTPPIEFIVKYLCPENITEGAGPPLVDFRFEYLDLSHRVIMAAFNRRRNEFTSGAQILRFQWWLSQRTFYHGELFAMILEVLTERFPDFLSLDSLLESYCDFFMVSDRSWAGVWVHASALGDGLISVNLLTILNLRQEQDISEAIPRSVFDMIEGSEVFVFSLDTDVMHPHLIRLIANSEYFATDESAANWSKTGGSNLLIALLKDDALDLTFCLSKPHIYQIDTKEVAKALDIHPDFVYQMVELRKYSTNYKFYRDILPAYPGLPITYLAQVFKEQEEDVDMTLAYLSKNAT